MRLKNYRSQKNKVPKMMTGRAMQAIHDVYITRSVSHQNGQLVDGPMHSHFQ